jgi:predicted N-acetyltransferase YhbS
LRITVRSETEEDYGKITNLHCLAFKRREEGRLVEKLRKTSDFIPELSLVAEYEKNVIGHLLLYPIKINTKTGKCSSLALAPISVHPDHQHKGVGSILIINGLNKAKQIGFKSVIVVGYPNYYPKFGFKKASKWGISAPFKVPDEAFMAIELTKNRLKNCNGIVEYPKEFEEL